MFPHPEDPPDVKSGRFSQSDRVNRTITLSPFEYARLRLGLHVWLDDSDGREVLLHLDGARPADVYDGALVGVLAPADVDLVEQPDGLDVTDNTGVTGWTVRAAPDAVGVR